MHPERGDTHVSFSWVIFLDSVTIFMKAQFIGGFRYFKCDLKNELLCPSRFLGELFAFLSNLYKGVERVRIPLIGDSYQAQTNKQSFWYIGCLCKGPCIMMTSQGSDTDLELHFKCNIVLIRSLDFAS